MRCTRMRLREWLIDHVDRGSFPDVSWIDRRNGILRIPWRHASMFGCTDRDSELFRAWAVYSGTYQKESGRCNPKRWKANFRCAVNSTRDMKMTKDEGRKNTRRIIITMESTDKDDDCATSEENTRQAPEEERPLAMIGGVQVKFDNFDSDSSSAPVHEEKSTMLEDQPLTPEKSFTCCGASCDSKVKIEDNPANKVIDFRTVKFPCLLSDVLQGTDKVHGYHGQLTVLQSRSPGDCSDTLSQLADSPKSSSDQKEILVDLPNAGGLTPDSVLSCSSPDEHFDQLDADFIDKPVPLWVAQLDGEDKQAPIKSSAEHLTSAINKPLPENEDFLCGEVNGEILPLSPDWSQVLNYPHVTDEFQVQPTTCSAIFSSMILW